MNMLIRLSAALLLSLLVSTPGHALLARRVIEHSVLSKAISSAECKADAARLCPGVAASDAQFQCLKQHKNALSFGCAREINKLERKTGQ
jgi:hypothetical protein